MRPPLRSMLTAVIAAVATCANADYYVIVQANNPQSTLTKKEAVDLFMGRTRSFSNGNFAVIFDLPKSSPQHAAFYRALVGLSPAQVNSYWSRLLFSGRNTPPLPLPDEAAMIDTVKRNPEAIGWLSNEPSDKQLRTVLILKD